MPAGDRTGPQGEGARTGRGKGLCSGNNAAGYADDENRRGAGRKNACTGRGMKGGRGRRQGGGFGRR